MTASNSMQRAVALCLLLPIVLVALIHAPGQALAHGGHPLGEIRFEQKLNAQIPLDLAFRDESGSSVRLGDYFGQQPVILVFGYYDCPMLCQIVFPELATSIGHLEALSLGSDYQVVTVSIDPGETPALAAETKGRTVEDPAQGWHFLTGESTAIERLANATGFHFEYDADKDEYAHPSGLIVLTPEGRIARYFYGIDFPPRDLRLSLVEAADGEVGSPVDQLLLLCYQYDPVTGRYTLLITNVLRAAAILSASVLGIALLVLSRRYRQSANPDGGDDLKGTSHR